MAFNKSLFDISNQIQNIYRVALEHSTPSFKRKVFEILLTAFSFDSGIWVNRSDLNDFKTIGMVEDTFVFNQPEDFMLNYQRLIVEENGKDPFYYLVANNPENVFKFSEAQDMDSWRQTRFYTEHMQKYDVEHGMGCMHFRGDNGFAHVICFYRGYEKDDFDENEKNLFKLFYPHLIEAFRINLLNLFKRPTPGGTCRAICDRYGAIIEAEERFYALSAKIVSEGKLALELNQEKVSESTSVDKYEVKIQFLQGFYYIEVFFEHPYNLTSRELQITQLLLKGKNNKQIEHELGISGSTVNNHLNSIFLKLNIKRREEIFKCRELYIT